MSVTKYRDVAKLLDTLEAEHGFRTGRGEHCCGSCAGFELGLEPGPVTYFNVQSLSSFGLELDMDVEERPHVDPGTPLIDKLHLSYGEQGASEERYTEIATTIVQVAGELRIPVDWDGDTGRCIAILPWGHDMSEQESNPFEAAARARKVAALAATAVSLFARHPPEVRAEVVLSEVLEGFDDAKWERLAKQAGVHPPSEETRRQVVVVVAASEVTAEALSAWSE